MFLRVTRLILSSDTVKGGGRYFLGRVTSSYGCSGSKLANKWNSNQYYLVRKLKVCPAKGEENLIIYRGKTAQRRVNGFYPFHQT